jgi:hypothetical protein
MDPDAGKMRDIYQKRKLPPEFWGIGKYYLVHTIRDGCISIYLAFSRIVKIPVFIVVPDGIFKDIT